MSPKPPDSRGATFKLNVAANYASQAYAGLIGLVMVPVYLRLMSGEAYGLVGFFALLQAWAQLLDLGLSATVAREAARHAGGAGDSHGFRCLLRVFEWMFWFTGALLAVLFALGAEAVANSWLNVRALPAQDVRAALQAMGLAVALRWIAGLYRGVIMGMERQVWLNVFNAAVVSLRFVGVLPVLWWMDASVIGFFVFQAVVSVAELAVLTITALRLAPADRSRPVRPDWPVLGPALRFSAGIAFATIVWVVVTQADKLVLSATMPLAEYGYFTAAVTAASAASLLSAAVSQAILPRLTQLAASGQEGEITALYRRTTRLVMVFGMPPALGLVFLAEPVLWAWTGDRSFARDYAAVLALYAAGNGFLTLTVFPYYLQYARGDLRLHVWGNALFAAVLVPAILYAATVHGAMGTAWVWAGANAAFFLLWTPIVHRRFAPGVHEAWLVQDILRPIALPLAMGAAAAWAIPPDAGRMAAATAVALACSLMCGAAGAVSGMGRRLESPPLYSQDEGRLP
ncbi:oligosaccharide flippase family protein [Caenimonas sedimenti]|uniref:Oligosaccharide flippase family protein n=1 Tax=Caenimonas sedimenti TaxID=2596921 RepID=A0A562ZG09_9BURK|nr:oligosaccharide flippase family protein [Caenimonas sedimenti]TWO66651.1 oligosaccharide flippase family protein [Caenimonas sedimenti]